MLRYIMKCNWGDTTSGASGFNHYTIDGDAEAVEKKLRDGGCGESGFETHELVGVEIIDS